MITVDNRKCVRCGGCVSVCPFDALELENEIKCSDRCTRCGTCVRFCPVGALTLKENKKTNFVRQTVL